MQRPFKKCSSIYILKNYSLSYFLKCERTFVMHVKKNICVEVHISWSLITNTSSLSKNPTIWTHIPTIVKFVTFSSVLNFGNDFRLKADQTSNSQSIHKKLYFFASICFRISIDRCAFIA
jgi:hypothetical protein